MVCPLTASCYKVLSAHSDLMTSSGELSKKAPSDSEKPAFGSGGFGCYIQNRVLRSRLIYVDFVSYYLRSFVMNSC